MVGALRGLLGRIGRPLAHPFLFAAFPVLSLLSSNVGEALPGEAVAPAGLMLLLTAVLWVILAPLVPGRHGRSLAITLFWVPFYGIGPLLDAYRRAAEYRAPLGLPILAIGLLAFIAVGLVFAIALRRREENVRRLAPFLNLTAAFAVAVAGLSTGQRLYAQHRASTPRAPQAAAPVENAPDIYYIILDAYTRADYMKELTDHDNTPFLDALRARGFYVAERSRSNYMYTQMSLASSLNMRHHGPELVRRAMADWDNTAPVLAQQIWDNKVMRLLRARGYQTVAIASIVVATDLRNADRYIVPASFAEQPFPRTEFQKKFVDMTVLRPIINRYRHLERAIPAVAMLDELEALGPGDGPRFVFVHVPAPHAPHIFDENGERIDPSVPFAQGYRDEVKYLNKRLLRIIDRILAEGPNSIIVLQGDHGPWSDWRIEYYHTNQDLPPWPGAWDAYVKDRTAILNAYYFPDRVYEGRIYPEITPVNTFRAVFNAFLGGNFDVERDTSYIKAIEGSGAAEITDVY